MPTLHRYADRPGHFVKGVMKGDPVGFQLTPEGEQYLTETLALQDGGKFAGDTLKWLYGKKWAILLEALPREVVASAPALVEAASPEVAKSAPPPAPVVVLPELNEIVFQGVIHVRLGALDQTLLDQSATDVVRTLGKTGATVFGPLPLPVQIDEYIVQREARRVVFEVRVYRRLVQVRNPRRHTTDAMNRFSLPREVEVQVEMQT